MTTEHTEAASGSAYPPPVDVLLPKARRLADKLGEVPSRNRLMTEFRIGAPKARAILAELTALAQPTDTETAPANRLHLVPSSPEPQTGATDPDLPTAAAETASQDSVQVVMSVDPGTSESAGEIRETVKPVKAWPVLLLAAPAFVAIWSGWVGLGGLTGFGVVHPLPGIVDGFAINTAITLPIGVETYAAYALRAWLAGRTAGPTRRFAKWSAIGALILGALGQVAYHLMSAAGVTAAPWWITTAVACLPVAVLGMGAALAHLLRTDETSAPTR
ncbi:ABC transporter permease [Fodinicola feengrottensis]|uniref:ABC transporter permease n=1 Tax=Fodinicola feengrottensis TaxID=435914 RepID=A0ABN2H2S1_9ACTN